MRLTIFCNHYQARMDHDKCKAGVEYEKFKALNFETRPCFCKNGEAKRPGCDMAEFPTAEELAAQDAEDALLLEKMSKARTAIVTHLGGPWKRGAKAAGGKIDCPACGAKEALHFSRDGVNGHIHARCATPTCVAWIE